MSAANGRAVEDAYRILWTIWASLAGSLVIYLAVAWVVAQGEGRPPNPLLAALLALVGVGLAAASLVLRRARLLDPIRSGKLDPRSLAGVSAVQRTSILLWALSESVALSGLILGVVHATLLPVLPFVGLSAILFAVHAPSQARLSAEAPRLGPARFHV